MTHTPPALPGETWAPIPGMDGKYYASTHGRIYSVPRANSRGGVMSPHQNTHGYQSVTLYLDRKCRSQRIHVLVALTHLGPRPEGADVRHLDCDKSNNRLENLAYGTRSENALDSVRAGHLWQTQVTHCPHGHEYSAENTYRQPSRPTARVCRTCVTTAQRERRRRLREAA